MRILFLGHRHGTSNPYISAAFGRLGHDVTVVDPEDYILRDLILSRLNWETGGLLSERTVTEGVVREIAGKRFDITWVHGGRYVGPSLVRRLREFGPVVNYNADDPYGRRDRLSFALFRRTVPCYDLVTVVRDVNIPEAHALGARKVFRTYISADEIANAPRDLSLADQNRWATDVLFVGTGMERRGAFMKRLLDLRVPLRIYGTRWNRCPEWRSIRHVCHGPLFGDDYTAAIQCSSICLGMLSRGNRDQYTHRSMEIPACGGLLCAERTEEHRTLYTEWREAVYWSDADECADVCHRLLADPELRTEIRRRGRTRCLANGYFNEKVLSSVLDALGHRQDKTTWTPASPCSY